MWIRERYFATWKRRNRAHRLPVCAGLLVVCGLGYAGCMVTDTIEFEDAVNHPPVVVASTAREKQSVCTDGILSFFVIVEDMDEDDPSDTDMAGMISLHNEIDTVAPYDCEGPRAPVVPITDGQTDSDEGATQIQITCPIGQELLSQIPVGVTTTVHVEVSDLGFVSANTPPADAYVVQVDWVIEVEDCD